MKTKTPLRGPRPRETGKTILYSVELTPDVSAALHYVAKAQNRTLRSVTMDALIAYLKKLGHLPADR